MDYLAILEEALLAAKKAVLVFQETYAEDGKEPNRGACGFAWAYISDKKHPFVKEMKATLKSHGFKYDGNAGNLVTLDGEFVKDRASRDLASPLGSPDHRGFWQWWNPGESHWQLVDSKEAGAIAFVNVLMKYDIPCEWSSRLD